MKRARRFVYLSLYCMLIVTCFSIGIFCLTSRTVNSYYEIYYTYTPSTLSKSLLQQYLIDNKSITEVYFDAFDNEERTSFTIDETTYQTSDCVLLGDTSENDDESVLAYTDSQATKMYILCTEKITFPVNCGGMFQDYSSLKKIKFENIETKHVTSMSKMFYGCESLTSLDLTIFNTEKVTSMDSMFFRCINLIDLNILLFDTSSVQNMGHMFQSCQSIKTLDLSHFNTSKVTQILYMFRECYSLENLNVSNFDTSRIDTGKTKYGFDCMFHSCESLTSLDLSSFNTTTVKDMAMMFLNCTKLKTLDISSFDTSNVTTMAGMFHSVGLTSLDLSHFKTSKVTDMHQMFYGGLIETLDISSFDTSKVTKMAYMFRKSAGIKPLSTIYIGDGWTTDALQTTEFKTLSFGTAIGDTGMFMGCINLPNFNSSYTGKTFAHAGAGGYLTYKQ